jgi:hypothetical protein
LCKFDQSQRHRIRRNGWNVAIGREQPRDGRTADEIARQIQVERRQRQCLVLHHFDGCAAVAEHQDRPEGRIIGEPEQQLARTLPRDHGLDDHALDSRAGPGAARPRDDFRRSIADALLARKVQDDPADIGFVRNVARMNFYRNGNALGENRLGAARRFVAISRRPRS